jgi:hypothetical protein
MPIDSNHGIYRDSGVCIAAVETMLGELLAAERAQPRRATWPAYQMGAAIPRKVPGDFAADRGIAAAAITSASVRRPMVMRPRATNERSVPE